MILSKLSDQDLAQISVTGISIIITVSAAFSEGYDYVAIVPTALCSIPIISEFIRDTLKKTISAEALVLMAIAGCILLGEYIAAAEIAIIMSIGELLEVIVTAQAKSGIDSLGRLMVEFANIPTSEGIRKVKVSEIEIGQILRVLPGEKIPLDGIIIQGNSSIDKSMITGESIPVDVSEGDRVFAGTSNQYGSFDMEVTDTNENSTVARMAELLKNADVGKSRIVNAADRWAKWILLLAAITTVVTYLVTSDIYRALTIMVVFCPCAFVLATPTGIMAAASNMARNGILLRDTSSLEGMARIKTVLFDKTGTLTSGKMKSLGFTGVSGDVDPTEMEHMVSALESFSEHPMGLAIVASHEPIGEVEDFRNIPGQGVTGNVNGHQMAAGNVRLMRSVSPDGLEDAIRMNDGSDATSVFVGMDGRTVGFIKLRDSIKPESQETIARLRKEGIQTVMLTGDTKLIGKEVSEKLDLDDVVWECLPETKLKVVEHYESKGPVCMIGDGMNDAPSLKRATVGISMGNAGNDLAIESSDLIFIDDNIGKMPGLIRLCRHSIRTIYFGLTLAMAINLAGVVLAIMGEIDPIAGAIIHNGGSFIVILLAASLLWSDPWTNNNV